MDIRVEGMESVLKGAIEKRVEFLGDRLTEDGVVLKESSFRGVSLSPETVQHLYGTSNIIDHPDLYYIVKGFDGENVLDQTILLLPFIGSAGEGLGNSVEMGCATTFVRTPVWYDDSALKGFLKEMGYKGFFSLGVHEAEIQTIKLGVPSYGIMALQEKNPSSLGIFDNPEIGFRFRESWAIASVINVWPCTNESDGSVVSGINDRVLKHFWPFAKTKIREGSFRSSNDLLGVATAWGFTPSKVVEQLMFTCKNVSAVMKQYRVDLKETIGRKMRKIEEFLT